MDVSALQRAIGEDPSDSIPQQQVVYACNIGRSGVQQRVWAGVLLLAATSAAAVAQILLHVPPLWRFSLAPFLFLGVAAILQARYKTCVMLALRNQVDMGDGEQALLDQGTRSIVRQRAWYISVASFCISVLVMAAIMLVPLLQGEWTPFGLDLHKWAQSRGLIHH
eukprot:TRINITY_DN3818_c0_g1_i1.p1 TRINITY_DN3818_c0_g1~~TRINITY_DN3818_c0_g1_i1.p1  ORF type:complete len:175 (+),score=53.32 TRINITY_DN3818_c0_g1_i1:30-527(+)